MKPASAIGYLLLAIALCAFAGDPPSPPRHSELGRFLLLAARTEAVMPDSRLRSVEVILRLDTATGQTWMLRWIVETNRLIDWIPISEFKQ